MNYCKDCKHKGINPDWSDIKGSQYWICDIYTKTYAKTTKHPVSGENTVKDIVYKFCNQIRHPLPGKIIENCPDYRPRIRKRIMSWLTGKP